MHSGVVVLMRLRVALAAVVAGVMLAAGPGAQAAVTSISNCGQTVTTNAVLTRDLYCPGSSGVVAGAPGITIDLKGFALRGDRSSFHYGIDDSLGFDKVSVKNGVVRNFHYGVYTLGSVHFSVSNLIASGNVDYGLLLLGASASVKSTTASGNTGVGIRLTGDSTAVTSSTASGNGSFGIYADGNAVSIRSSTASGNGSYGIDVAGASASITSSTTSGNGDGGLVVIGDAARIKGNRAEGNGFFAGSSDLGGLGVHAYGFTTVPSGTNVARGNDDPAECDPQPLC